MRRTRRCRAAGCAKSATRAWERCSPKRAEPPGNRARRRVRKRGDAANGRPAGCSLRATAAVAAPVLRGGAFKPRTSPDAFQGVGELGLRILADVREEAGLPVVTEVVSAHDVAMVARYADMLQIDTRNKQNFGLLQAVGEAGKPVLLKRGMSASIDEWLMAAEYVAQRGNLDIVLCERGIRTFETATRNT